MWRFGLVLVGMVAFSSTAHGQSRLMIPLTCGPAEVNEQLLRSQYKEEPVSGGPTTGNALAELWTSEETGTWSLVLRTTDGRLCLMSSGMGWKPFPENKKGVGL